MGKSYGFNEETIVETRLFVLQESHRNVKEPKKKKKERRECVSLKGDYVNE